MKLTRREYLKTSGAGLVGLAAEAEAYEREGVPPFPLHKRMGEVREVPTVCTGCAVGCGQAAVVADGRVVNLEGNPDHPINRGALCPKGVAEWQIVHSPRRNTKVLYRAPGSDTWAPKAWDWALDQIARRIKLTRDKHFIAKDPDGATVNRLEAMAYLGGAVNTNEEVYFWVKALRALGLVYVEHQARI